MMDRVSNLPDEILCNILSCLPTKNAASTSVLSKRWLNLWKLIPNLDIDDSVFLHPEDGNKGEREEIKQSFVQFVDNVLSTQDQSPIKKFSLKCITGVHPDIVNRWICNVVQRGVSDLNLFTDFADEEDTEEDMYALPKEMFFSSTLVKLNLRSERCVSWWQSSLPMLKSLDIDSDLILFFADFEEIIPSFPVLEELRLANMTWHESDVTVSSASLRKLSLHCTGCGGVVNPKGVSFDTPNLISLNYSDFVAEDYPLLNMGNLSEARINFTVTDDQVKRGIEPNIDDMLEDDDDWILNFGNVVKLLNVIQNAQKISLPSGTLEVLSLYTESIPVFNNLEFLVVSSKENRGWQAMPVILRNCPHLESLIIEGLLHNVTDKCGDACPCIAREDRGHSLTSCPVNWLEIREFRGTMKEMTMIKHFLEYFPCLKRLDVFIEENDPTQLRNREVSKLIREMLELYNKLWPSCCVQLFVAIS